jgi:hypothetical protein
MAKGQIYAEADNHVQQRKPSKGPVDKKISSQSNSDRAEKSTVAEIVISSFSSALNGGIHTTLCAHMRVAQLSDLLRQLIAPAD